MHNMNHGYVSARVRVRSIRQRSTTTREVYGSDRGRNKIFYRPLRAERLTGFRLRFIPELHNETVNPANEIPTDHWSQHHSIQEGVRRGWEC
jgi:hypothetical protein